MLIHARVLLFILKGIRGSSGPPGQPGAQGPPVSNRFCATNVYCLQSSLCDESFAMPEWLQGTPDGRLVIDRNIVFAERTEFCVLHN